MPYFNKIHKIGPSTILFELTGLKLGSSVQFHSKNVGCYGVDLPSVYSIGVIGKAKWQRTF